MGYFNISIPLLSRVTRYINNWYELNYFLESDTGTPLIRRIQPHVEPYVHLAVVLFKGSMVVSPLPYKMPYALELTIYLHRRIQYHYLYVERRGLQCQRHNFNCEVHIHCDLSYRVAGGGDTPPDLHIETNSITLVSLY